LDYFRIWAKMYGKRIEESKVTKDNMTYPRISYEVKGWEKVTICYVETTLYSGGMSRSWILNSETTREKGLRERRETVGMMPIFLRVFGIIER